MEVSKMHAQWKPQMAPCGGFSQGINKPTTSLTSHANDFTNAKSHTRKKPLLAGYQNTIFNNSKKCTKPAA